MNKIHFKLIIAFFFCLICPLEALEYAIALRSAAYVPTSDKLRRIYGDVHPNFQIEGSKTWCSPFEIWGNIDYFTKYKKHNDCCHTRATVVNLSAGAKSVYPFYCNFDFYLGAGLVGGKIFLHNKSWCGSEKVSKWAWGPIVKTGIRYHFSNQLFVDLFADYVYQPTHFHHTVDIGGFKTGIGVGLDF